ncbi:sulfite exporter TauE/SafE family protein [Microbacterium sp. USHLN186]|uniref:sulfite exporter TauE/SafE family protein n=1 Tax=Microbacterium sp. USHLN186 TaxID=3081286 RepID=UPI0030193D1C
MITTFSPLELGLLALAALGAGVINTVVGSGSLIVFPTLLALGLPPVPANMANTVGLAIGNVAGVVGYRRELRGQWRPLVPLIVLTIIGAVLGALALLVLPAEVFRLVAPVLIIVGCLLVAVQPLMNRRAGAGRIGGLWPRWLEFPLIFGTGVYGGYFGAAQGVLIVGILELTTGEKLQRVNAMKNVLQTVAGGVATAIFLFSAPLPWVAVVTIAVGSLAGAGLGAVIGRRLPAWLLRTLIVVIGALAVFLLLG